MGSQKNRLAHAIVALGGIGAGLGAFATTANAQAFQVFDGPALVVVETVGPAAGPCAYPTGPVVGAFGPVGPWPCPVAGPVPFGALIGGVTVDRATNTTWMTDGIVLTQVAPGGAILNSFAGVAGPLLGGPLTGISWDTGAGILWVTDGAMAAAIVPPPPPGCGPPAGVAVPPFPLGPLPGGIATGITWDPFSASLFVVDVTGFVANILPGGGAGPFGAWPLGALGCVGAPVTGITVDTASTPATGVPTLFLVDGAGLIQATTPGGAPPPPTIYATAPCFPAAAGYPVGIGFSARGISYGVGADNTGLAPPTIGSIGQAISPNPAFLTTIMGSVGGSTAVLYGTTGGFLCPAPIILGLPVLISPAPALLTLGIAIVGGGGAAVVPTPLLPGLPPGFTFNAQWLAITPGSLQVTDGLHITVALP